MPFSVEDLIEGRPGPVTITREESVTEALSLMIEHDFSQLPVVDTDHCPLGMVTYEGILRGVHNFHASINDLHVRDVMLAAPQFNLEDDLFDFLEKLKQTNAALIVDPSRKLVGIVTSYDTTEYFRSRAEHMMRVEDIEFIIKEFIVQAYTQNDGEIDETKLNKVISKVTTHEKNQKSKGFDDLSLDQYISILVYEDEWLFFEPVFNISRDAVGKLLRSVRDTRNDLAHFRSEITPDQTDQLRFCADWLARRWEEYEQTSSQDSSEQVGVISDGEQLVEEAMDIATGDEARVEQQIVPIIAEEAQPKESRYTPLADWLQSRPGRINKVKLFFDQIVDLIGGPLPASAYTHRSWWANDAHNHPHSQMWLDVGWRRTFLNMTNEQVTFVRIREREKAILSSLANCSLMKAQIIQYTVDVYGCLDWTTRKWLSPGIYCVTSFL